MMTKSRAMRIVVWGINYWPEVVGIAPFNRGMCRFLAGRGHQVRMVSTFAYYPAWQKAAKDRRCIFRTEIVDGIPVHRCWHFVPARATTLRRILHELSFGVTSFLRVLSLPRADLYIVVSPPLVLGPLAWTACMLKRSRYVFHVQDLQPDAAVGLGMMKATGVMARILHGMAAQTYRHASVVSGISHSMIEAFAEKGVPAEKRYWFPNWVEERETGRRISEVGGQGEYLSSPQLVATGTAGWRARYGIPEEAFLASYSGNLGRKQGLDVLLDAAEMLLSLEKEADGSNLPVDGDSGCSPKVAQASWVGDWCGMGVPRDSERSRRVAQASQPASSSAGKCPQAPPHVSFVIAGDGVMRTELEARLQKRPLSNVRLLPLLPEADYHEMLAESDVCLITQAKGTGRFFLPSKLLSILEAGRPVVALADDTSELARAVREGGFGEVVPSENAEGLARTLNSLATAPGALTQYGLNGASWVARFEANSVLGQFEARLR